LKSILEKTKFLTLIGVVSTLIASASAFVWGLYKSGEIVVGFLTDSDADTVASVALIEIMDIFLIAIVLLIFALGIYELFVGKLNVPEWLIVRNLHDLKIKLSSVVIMVMGIVFLKHLVEWQDPQGTLFFGLGVAVVASVLVAFGYFGSKTD